MRPDVPNLTGVPSSAQPDVPRLHVLTDVRRGRDPMREVRAALATGRCAVQVRAKEYSDRDVFDLTLRLLEMSAATGSLVLVNDRVDVALAAGADGVHLGVTDLPVERVREVVPRGFLVGVTARDVAAARRAEAAGADYLGVGPAYATTTKEGLPDPLGPEGVAAVAAATDLPVIAVGGVDASRVPRLLAAGAHGVAVVGALSSAEDPAVEAAALAAAVWDRREARAAPPPAVAPKVGATFEHR